MKVVKIKNTTINLNQVKITNYNFTSVYMDGVEVYNYNSRIFEYQYLDPNNNTIRKNIHNIIKMIEEKIILIIEDGQKSYIDLNSIIDELETIAEDVIKEEIFQMEERARIKYRKEIREKQEVFGLIFANFTEAEIKKKKAEKAKFGMSMFKQVENEGNLSLVKEGQHERIFRRRRN